MYTARREISIQSASRDVLRCKLQPEALGKMQQKYIPEGLL